VGRNLCGEEGVPESGALDRPHVERAGRGRGLEKDKRGKIVAPDRQCLCRATTSLHLVHLVFDRGDGTRDRKRGLGTSGEGGEDLDLLLRMLGITNE